MRTGVVGCADGTAANTAATATLGRAREVVVGRMVAWARCSALPRAAEGVSGRTTMLNNGRPTEEH